MKSRDLHTWMWAEALSMLDEADRLQRQFFRIGGAAGEPLPAPVWEPPVDVIETTEAIVLEIALPGVSADSVVISVEPEFVSVSAFRAFPLGSSAGARIHRIEIPYGRFERRIALPTHLLELRGRDLANGCLRLTLVKKEIT